MDERKLTRRQRADMKTRKVRVIMPRVAVRTDMRAPLEPSERMDEDPMASRLHWAAPLQHEVPGAELERRDREFWVGFLVGVASAAVAILAAAWWCRLY